MTLTPTRKAAGCRLPAPRAGTLELAQPAAGPQSRGRWKIFAVFSGLYVIAYFYRVSAAVIAGDLAADLDLSSRELGSVSAALFYAFALTQLPLGPLLDRIGPRRMVFALGLVTAAGALLFATAAGFAGALWGRILIGVGTSCVLMASLKAYTAWFSPDRFATLAGLQVALGNAGNLLATLPLAWLAATAGWRSAFVAFALLSAAGAAAVFLVARDAPPAGDFAAGGSFFAGWRQVARRPAFWGISLLAFFWYGNYMAVQGLWGGPYLMEVFAVGRQGAGRLLMLTALGFILGCPLAGRLSDRLLVSRKKVLAAGQLGLLLLASLFLGPLEAMPRMLLPAVFFAFGLCVATGPLLYAQVKELFPAGMAGTAMTAVNFFVVMGAAVMQQVMGQVMAAGNTGGAAAPFHAAFAVPVSGLAAAWVGYLFCPDTRPGRRP